jgi:hypothetical protein
MRGLSPLVAQGLIVLGVLGLLGLLAWSARRGRPEPGPNSLLIRHSPAFRLTALFTVLAAPLVLVFAMAVFPPLREEARYVLLAFAVALAVTLPVYWESARYYALVTPQGIEGRSPWRAARYFAWDDIREVRFNPAAGWFAFEAWDGDHIRVPAAAANVSDLLRTVETYVPTTVLKKARTGWERVGRPFPRPADEPVLEARPPRRN